VTKTTLTARAVAWLDRPPSAAQAVAAWIVSVGAFVVVVLAQGGPSGGDAGETVNTTWALAHLSLRCAFAPSNSGHLPYSAPLYPVVSAAVVALARVGHAVAFPGPSDFGRDCATQVAALTRWSLRARSFGPTLRVGYVAWAALAAGVVALLRAGAVRRSRWEAMTLFLLALAPPVAMTLADYFHPQDLLATGLLLGALAAVLRERWGVAGILFGLAVASHQFAVLVLLPVALLTPASRRVRLFAGVVGAYAVVVGPLALLTSGRALRWAVVGSAGATTMPGSLLAELHVRGAGLFVVARVLPVVAALVVAWWVEHRRADVVRRPAALVGVVAMAFTLRLVFEANAYGYYFMALSVALVVGDVLRRRLPWRPLVWIGVVTLAFSSWRWGVSPIATMVPVWARQVIVVGSGLALALDLALGRAPATGTLGPAD
jgi:hypothetical protein